MKQLKEKIEAIAKTLQPRSYDVLKRRFGLENEPIQTLQAIGNKYKITRERVRQIEESSLKNINNQKTAAFLKQEIKIVRDYISEHGNVVAEHFIVSQLAKKGAHSGALLFLLRLIPELDRYQGSKEFHPHWCAEKEKLSLMAEVNKHIKDEFSKRRVIATLEEIIDILKKRNLNIDYKHAMSYIEVSRHIKKNHFGHYGIKNWPEINPRGVRDKSYLVLRQLKKPLHFKEVASLIYKLGLSKTPAHVQTVHNELIKDDRFVLIGRGIYSLKEWGYEKGTVRDVIIKVLKNSSSPMTKDEILREVLKQRLVKPNTIILNLHNNKIFSRTEDGRFFLNSNEL